MKVESGTEIALVGQRVEIIMIVVVLICEWLQCWSAHCGIIRGGVTCKVMMSNKTIFGLVQCYRA